ncbi:hypothetical protein C8J56DRAFT_953926 [Mycena floridula]|nr:hypothetical protein C8J56DRAFT_953926 [Mycena floridula]
MHFNALIVTSLLFITGNAAPDIVWNPKITSPVAGTVWISGRKVNVTWDLSGRPDKLTQPLTPGRLQLRQGGFFPSGRSVGFIAEKFNLRAGFVEVTIVLFGDSGNIGPDFSIVAP